jgi:hypothetical protein
MAFQAGFLPAQSWTTMMAGLAEHFGENAELDADTARHITGYLTANAADAGRPTRGAPQAIPLLRITETAWWRRKHEKKGRVSPETMTRRGAKLKSDCVACHQDAARGMFDDD